MKFTCAVIMQITKQSEDVKFGEWDLPIGLSLNLTRMMDKIYKEQANIEKERMRILKKHCKTNDKGEIEPDENGNAQIEDMEGFEKDFKELLEQEIEVDIKPLKLDMEKLEGINKKPREISWMIPLLEIEDEG